MTWLLEVRAIFCDVTAKRAAVRNVVGAVTDQKDLAESLYRVSLLLSLSNLHADDFVSPVFLSGSVGPLVLKRVLESTAGSPTRRRCAPRASWCVTTMQLLPTLSSLRGASPPSNVIAAWPIISRNSPHHRTSSPTRVVSPSFLPQPPQPPPPKSELIRVGRLRLQHHMSPVLLHLLQDRHVQNPRPRATRLVSTHASNTNQANSNLIDPLPPRPTAPKPKGPPMPQRDKFVDVASPLMPRSVGSWTTALARVKADTINKRRVIPAEGVNAGYALPDPNVIAGVKQDQTRGYMSRPMSASGTSSTTACSRTPLNL